MAPKKQPRAVKASFARPPKTLLLVIPALAVAGLLLVVAWVSRPQSVASACPMVDGSGADGRITSLSPAEGAELIECPGVVLLDVRTAEEFAAGHIAGAVNFSLTAIEQGQAPVAQREVPVVVYCRSGSRSATAARLLESMGYQSIYDLGGIATWQAQGYAVVR